MKKQEAFLKLYEPIHDKFERFCRARVYGQMDYTDLMNETLLIAFEKMNELKNPTAFFSFLCGISVRILSNHNKKHKEVQYPIHVEQHRDWNSSADLKTDVKILYKMLNQLNEEQKEAILLFELSGFSIKEIADMQAVNESTVKQRLKRGRDRLKGLMNFEADLTRKEVKHG